MSTTTLTPAEQSAAAQEQGRATIVSTAAITPEAVPTGNLEITVSRAELLRELTAAQSVVERKTTIPILSNFLFEATVDELGAGRLTITATDLDQSLRTSCAAKVKKPGACTIPARKLYDYIKLLPEGDISHQAHGQPLGPDPRRPLQHQDGRHGPRQLPPGPRVPRRRRLQNLRRPRSQHDREDHLRHLQRRVPLHPQRRPPGPQGRVHGHGRHRRPPPRPHRKARRNPRRHLRRKEDPHPPQGARRALQPARHHRRRNPRVRRRRPDPLLPRRRPRPHQPQAHRPVPQLRSRPPARQQQVRHRPLAKTSWPPSSA